MELGLYTFADISADPVTGEKISPQKRIENLLEEIVLAEEVGLDVFAIGEHHRPEFVVSSPAIVLAAAAVKTKKIKLSSAVTVLSSDDPVRVFQDFATIDLLSAGRAEIMAGRGSFIESFPLFGYELHDYDELFSEKLKLLLLLNENEIVSWKGKHRPDIDKLGVYPRPAHKLPVWVAVGGTPASVTRAATLGLPLALAIIGGYPDQFAPLIELYRKTYLKSGFAEADLQVGINGHVFIGDTSQKAADDFYPPYAEVMTRLGRERGWSPMNRSHFDMMRAPEGSLMVGDVQEVTDKILYEYELFHHTRFMAQMGVGSIPHNKVMHAIELFGDKVAPAVRKALAK